MVDTTSPPVAAGQSACSPDNPAPLLGQRSWTNGEFNRTASYTCHKRMNKTIGYLR